LGVFLLKQGIRLLYGAVRHPQTQGKVERFHRTLAERLRWAGVPTTLTGFHRAFAWCRDKYNQLRPHEALGLEPPTLHFRPSPRAYQARPRPWLDPTGSAVCRVRGNGQIMVAGRNYFVSSALEGEEVACVPHADRVLVRYRHMYVRELHPRTTQSVALMQPIDRPMDEALTC
jgi:hypothetical protein